MADSKRIEELEQRLRNDPASIAFAHLGEEYRRAGRIKDAIATCRAGLVRHPGYLSARVTLGRSLLELGELDAAQHELTEVRGIAPENLAAIRGLAEVHRRRGELSEALEQYRTAFELAQNDPGIDQIVKDLRKQIEPSAALVTRPSPSSVGPPAAADPPASHAQAALPASHSARPLPEDPEMVRTRRIVLLLERWLEGILADRRTRIYGAQPSGA